MRTGCRGGKAERARPSLFEPEVADEKAGAAEGGEARELDRDAREGGRALGQELRERDADALPAVRVGFDGILLKPVTLETLVQVLAEILPPR